MKLAFSTLGCPDWTWEQILENAKAYGFDGFEVRGIGDELDSTKLTPFLPENAAETRKQLDALGLSLCCLNTSISLHDEARVADALREIDGDLAVCRRMGFPYMRVFGDQINPEAPQESLACIIRGLRALCEKAAPDVGILLEIHGTFNTPEVLLATMEQVPFANLGFIWDIQHSDRVHKDDFLPYYRAIAPYIKHVHIKDGLRDGNSLAHTPVGEGELPVRAIVETLLADGYGGFFSLEWEKRWIPELPPPEVVFPAYVEWMRKHITKGDA